MSWRFVLALVFTARAEACSCAGGWPSVKQAWAEAPSVFLGTVEVADPDGSSGHWMFQEQFVRIRVDEAFKGVKTGQTIELHLGATDCDAKFQTGQRAVFYLHQDPGSGGWVVPWCTYSLGSAAPAGDDLLFLHGLPKSARGTRLSGEVELYEDSPEQAFKRLGGVPNVSVKISASDGSIAHALTNEEGVYEVYNLHPGKYSVSIGVPKGLKIDSPSLPVHCLQEARRR